MFRFANAQPLYLTIVLSVFFIDIIIAYRPWVTTDELENHISPEDLEDFVRIQNEVHTTRRPDGSADYADIEATTIKSVYPGAIPVDCFGLGSIMKQVQTWLLNMRPDTSDKVNTHFYFSSRDQPNRVQVYPGDQFGLEWVDFKASRKTLMIVHGFMSHSNASWVHDMTRAFLYWADVNVIAVDWSGGGNTWKYWRAVANTRRVGADVTGFLRQLIAASGAGIKDFHFVGHSLGAHISSYVSYHLGGVSRITAHAFQINNYQRVDLPRDVPHYRLDPAQPCFRTSNHTERLDVSDADYVDVIHTNGRLLSKIGFGLPDPTGHADFYPNGGMKQPGCYNKSNSILTRWFPFSPSKLQQAVCSHGRAYLLFTESLINSKHQNCSFRAHRWNLTYEGVNASLQAVCDRWGSCSEMGIKAGGGFGAPRASGPYFVLTTDTVPYCPSEEERRHPRADLLRDLREGFKLDQTQRSTTTEVPDYADPELVEPRAQSSTAKPKWWSWLG